MAREPEDEEPAGAAARARGHRGLPGRAGAGALRPSLWLFCLVACWLLGAVARADFSILDEAQVLASQMRRLAAEELGVVTMQVRGPHCAPKLARHSASPAQSPFPRAGPRDRAPTSPARTAHLPLPLSRDTSVLCTGSPTPICTPTLPCAQVLFPFSSAEAIALCTGPTLPPSQPVSPQGFSDPLAPPSLVCTTLLRSLVFTPVAPANFPSLFVCPSRGSRPRLARMVFRGPQPTP